MIELDSPAAVHAALGEVGYRSDTPTDTSVFLALRLGKPLLVEGPAGVGKTELAKAVAAATGAGLIRLQCYEGLDESRALYEWNYKKQLLRIQAAGDSEWDATHDDIFAEDFLLERPLLAAIRAETPTVLLIDEIDKADVEFEALLLEVLSDFQVSIPELGTIAAVSRPFVVLTSNAARDLSEALKRRCLYVHLDYPSEEREVEIVTGRVVGIRQALAEQIVGVVHFLRGLDLRKPPSISETIDWARTLIELGADTADEETVRATLGVALKHVSDQRRAEAALSGEFAGTTWKPSGTSR
ncbi:MoxR family ATPase [soil metagenome]